MAGEWIKVEIGLPEKPEVLKVARLLSLHRDQVVGTMVRFWGWLRANSVDGTVTHIALRDVDDVVGCQGFAAALRDVGWLVDNPENGISVPNFERHNSESAKKRALTVDRQKRFRNAPSVTEALPEKRREEKKETPIASSAKALSAVNGDAVAYIPLNDGSEFGVSQDLAAELQKLYPAVDIPQTLNEIRGWNLANPARRKTKRGIVAHLNSWMSREQNRGPKG